MKMLKTFVLIIISMIYLFGELAIGCEVLVRIKSDTQKPFLFQLSIPGMFQEQVEFGGPGEKDILVKEQNCAAKRWKMLTMGRDEGSNWVAVDEVEAKLDGIGEVIIQIDDQLQPKLASRLGVACSEATLNFCI